MRKITADGHRQFKLISIIILNGLNLGVQCQLGLGSPEKDCCWRLQLTFQQPEWNSSSEHQ